MVAIPAQLRSMLTPEKLEEAMNDKRVRVGAGIVAAVVLGIAVGLAVKTPRVAKLVIAPVSERVINIPILRDLPEPQPMKARAGAPSPEVHARQLLARRGR